MENNKYMDWMWKISTLLIGVVLVPTFGWVWNMQVQMTSIKKDIEYAKSEYIELKEDVGAMKSKVDGFSSTNTNVEWLKTSLDSLNNKLDRIETRLVNL